MVTIFHGDNIVDSRQALSQHLSSLADPEILRLSSKSYNPDSVIHFLNSNSLFGSRKILSFENFFSLPKPSQDKILKSINSKSDVDIVIWQDKFLTAAQLKIFPKSEVKLFKLDNQLYACLNAVKPGGLPVFYPLYRRILSQNQYDLFLYLLKGNLRRQLSGFSRINSLLLKQTYLQLIDLDYYNKTGRLNIPKEIALERIILKIIK